MKEFATTRHDATIASEIKDTILAYQIDEVNLHFLKDRIERIRRFEKQGHKKSKKNANRHLPLGRLIQVHELYQHQ